MKSEQDNKELKQIDSGSNQNNKKQIPDLLALEIALGAVSILSIKSHTHKYTFVLDYEWLVVPAITLKQFALFRNKKKEPIAFVSWALISPEVESRLLRGTPKLQPKDWQSGDQLYIVDIISPFVPQKDILKQLNDKQFSGKKVKFLSPKKDDRGAEMQFLKDVNFD